MKILEKLRKLFEKKIEKYDFCIICKRKLSGRQRKFCSPYCANKYWHNKNKRYIQKLEIER